MGEFADQSREFIMISQAVSAITEKVKRGSWDEQFLIHWGKEEDLSNAAIDKLLFYVKPIGITESMLSANEDKLAKTILGQFAQKREQGF